MITRRGFLLGSAASVFAKISPGLKLGVMDGVVGFQGDPRAVAAAAELRLEGLQVTLGRSPDGTRLALDDSARQAALRAASDQHRLPLDATYIDILHTHCLKNDPKARDLVADGIRVTKALNARILMTVFFGECAVASPKEIDFVADVFRELAPEAQRAGVILGFENLLKAEDSARVMDRVASEAFKVYYDVGNATNLVGVDAAKEIRWLGRDRICQFHFKDKVPFGSGKVDFPAILAAIGEIGFSGYANLEIPRERVKDDLAYLRSLA